MALYQLTNRSNAAEEEARLGFIVPFTGDQDEQDYSNKREVKAVKATIVKFKRKTKARVFRFLDTRKGKWSSNYHSFL